MKMIKGLLLMLMILIVSAVAQAQVLPVTIDKLEVNDIELVLGSLTRLDVARGATFDVELVFTPSAAIEDMDITLLITGDDTTRVPVTASTGTKDYDAGVTYQERLLLTPHDDFERDDYKLRVILSDDDSDTLVQDYNLRIDTERDSALSIDDIVLYPSVAKAGSALLTTVRVENKGKDDEESVKVEVAIPALGVRGSDYIDEVREDREEETEEIFMQLPNCGVEPGTYDVEVSVTWDEGFSSLKEVFSIPVVASDTCVVNANAASASMDDGMDEEPQVEVVVHNTVVEAPQPEAVSEEASASMGDTKSVLEIILIILLVILIIVGIVVGVSKLREGSEEDEDDEEF